MEITTTCLVLEVEKVMGDTYKTIRKVHIIHTSTDRKRYIMESANGRGAVKLTHISAEKFVNMSKALDEHVFNEIQ